MDEAWRDLLPGDAVKVARPTGNLEKMLLGAEGFIVRFDATHGYAVVLHAGREWHLHPEALERVA